MDWADIESILEEISFTHKEALLKCGRRIIPNLTSEDVLQPNDYSELNHHPEFRYEEGMLAGIQTVYMALRALNQEKLPKVRRGSMPECVG